ncbi:hypothetical protein [Synechococcus sp. PCC 6312]|uniref:hypothetical protein n=1 Tax=Synechococcus sp. (strain ATCC 27167 / PCC 6312) TaxID=195253 RepID=UPI00029EF3E3|nr:hypothetical protein [Synechococcus sp. PCC 6312]AFY62741.1 hypothetical protein Syn6312_3729 [Synechococcus sp. PCC 6312]
MQTLDKRFEVDAARTDECLKGIEDKIGDLKQEVSDLRTQQRATDSRILTFIFPALAATLGLWAKVVFFDTKA